MLKFLGKAVYELFFIFIFLLHHLGQNTEEEKKYLLQQSRAH